MKLELMELAFEIYHSVSDEAYGSLKRNCTDVVIDKVVDDPIVAEEILDELAWSIGWAGKYET